MLYLLTLCNNPELLSVIRVIKLLMIAIQIAAPIMLVVFVMIEFFNVINEGKDGALKKAFNNSLSRCIACIVLFLVPTFVNVVIGLSTMDNSYKSCLDNATVDKIQSAYNDRAREKVNIAKEKLTDYSYQDAMNALENMSDGEEKNNLLKELENLDFVIKAKELIEVVRDSKKDSDYSKAVDAVNNVEDKEKRKELEEELEQISLTMNKYVSDYSSNGNYIENTLGIPHYQQCDSRWGNIKYDIGGGTDGGMATLCSSSCGYTSFSMIAAGLNRDFSITPPTVVSRMRGINLALGEYTKRGYGAASTSELTNSTYMSYYGLKAKNISGSGEVLRQNIMRELNSGHALIIFVPGHYMTLAPSSDSSKVVLLDPFSNWADSRRGSGITTLENISNIYGGIRGAISYSK